MLYASAGSLKGFAAMLGGEEATASHILVNDQSTAVSLLERLRDGPQDNLEDRFAREAGKYSECPSKSKVGERERERERARVPCVFCAALSLPSPRWRWRAPERHTPLSVDAVCFFFLALSRRGVQTLLTRRRHLNVFLIVRSFAPMTCFSRSEWPTDQPYPKGGLLGTFKPGQMVKEFNDAVFTGPVGEIQGPVKTKFGYHLILVTDRVEKEA